MMELYLAIILIVVGTVVGIAAGFGFGICQPAFGKRAVVFGNRIVFDRVVPDAHAQYGKTAAAKDETYKLPSPAIAGDTLEFSFSGLKTAAINLVHKFEQNVHIFIL